MPEDTPTPNTPPAEGIDPIRRQKLDALRAAGRDPFAAERFDVTHHATEIAADFDRLEGHTVLLAGRITSLRLMGKAAFLDLTDATGRIQLYLRRDEIGDDLYGDIQHHLDLGDIAGISGFVFKTKTGETSVHVREWTLLAKSLRPLPFGKEYETEAGEEKHAGGLRDPEQRYRQRSVDLLVNRESRQRLLGRMTVTRAMREYLDKHDYLEVETPVLQTIAGGAAARPFLTHHNALGMELHLRISLELYLKRLIIGGLDRVYEIGRVFRNEGISTRHNPEFTMMEVYAAYANLDDMMTLVEGMYRHACRALHAREQFSYQGQEIDLAPSFARLPILEGIRLNANVDPEELATLEAAHAVLTRLGLPTEKEPTVGGIIEKLHEKYTQPTLIPRGKLALFLGHECVQLVEFEHFDARFLLTLFRRGRGGDIGRGGIDPVGDGLRIDPQMPGDASQVGTVYIELEGLAAQIESVAVVFRLGRIGAPAVSAFAAQGAGGVFAGAMLFGGFAARGTSQSRFSHRLL